jgi:hypothetical protein
VVVGEQLHELRGLVSSLLLLLLLLLLSFPLPPPLLSRPDADS